MRGAHILTSHTRIAKSTNPHPRISDMPNFPPSPKGTGRSPRSHCPRQTQSHRNSPTDGGLDGTQDEITTNIYRRISSLRLPGKVSGGLLAKVSKFEALDALSVPFTIKHPHLQPAPLHVLHKVRSPLSQKAELGYGKSGERRKLSTIFGPQTRTTEVEARVIRNSEVHHERKEALPERSDVFDSLDVRKLQESLEKVKARIADTTIEVCYKPSSIRLREGLRGQTLSPQARYAENFLTISRVNTPSRPGNPTGTLVPISRDRNASPLPGGPFKINTPVRISSIKEKPVMAISHEGPFTPLPKATETFVVAPRTITTSIHENTAKGHWEVSGRGSSPVKKISTTATTSRILNRLPVHENPDRNIVVAERNQRCFEAPRGMVTEKIVVIERDRPHPPLNKPTRNFAAALEALKHSQAKYSRVLAASERERVRSPSPHQKSIQNVVAIAGDKSRPPEGRSVRDHNNNSQVQSSLLEKHSRYSMAINHEQTRSPSPHAKALGTFKGLFTRCTAKDGVHGSTYSSHEKSFGSRTANYRGRPHSPHGTPARKLVAPHNVVEEGLDITKRTSFSMRNRISFFDGGKFQRLFLKFVGRSSKKID